jgi:hypothetical protein
MGKDVNESKWKTTSLIQHINNYSCKQFYKYRPQALTEQLILSKYQLRRKRFMTLAPGFRGSVVDKVDGVQVHVLNVPAEGGFPHSEVEVRGQNALQNNSQLVQSTYT